MAIIQILLGQIDLLWRDPVGNLEKLERLLDPLTGSERTLLVLPEMMSTGFTDDLECLIEPPDGPWELRFRELLARRRLSALVGLARRHGEEIYNESLVFHVVGSDSGPPQHAYRKIRPFKSENKVVRPGTEVSTFSFSGATVCPLICYDLRFPELFRAGLRAGTEIFVVIASWPDLRHGHWEGLLRARAIENQAYVIGVNRCGQDPHFSFAGGSLVVDPHGEVVHHAGAGETIAAVEIDLEAVRSWRQEFPAVADYLNDPERA